MRRYSTTVKNPKILSKTSTAWIRGLNTLVSPTQIKYNELSAAYNIELIEDGKIKFPRDGQSYFGSSSGSKITGIAPFYASDGTKKLIRMAGTALQEYNASTGDWDNISGKTYTTGLDTNMVMAYDKLYICNGTDNLTKYDGSSITVFTEISAPATPTITRTGSTGSYTFSYKITAINNVGETVASSAGEEDLNQSTLDTTSYMTVSWSAVTDAVGYNVYGRKDGDWRFLAYVEGNASVSFKDDGSLDPSTVFTPPEGNSTGGQKGAYIELYKDSLFILGDEDNPSRLYYSGGGDKIDDFTIENGGGFIDVSKNDGQKGTGLKVFKDKILIFKEDSIYQFSFTSSGLPQVVQVTDAVGALSPRSIVSVENDVFFASRRGIFTIGNEAGYAFDVLRTNELSAKIRSVFQTIEGSRMENISAVYATKSNKNLIIFSYTETGGTTNNKAIVYDRERLAWYQWSNIQANCWADYVDSDGDQYIVYGDDASGYSKEILTGSDDFGSAIRAYASLKGEIFNDITRYKTLKNVHVVLREPTGTVLAKITVDGTRTDYTGNLATISPTINWGHYLFGGFLFGSSYGTGAVTASDDIIVRRLKNINLKGRSFVLTIDNNSSANSSFVLLTVKVEGKYKSLRYYADGEVVED